MEAWFRRAMLANPDNYIACNAKENFLYPRWQGSTEEAIAFARECIRTGTPRNRIPLVILGYVDDHRAIADDSVAFMTQATLWPDIQSAFTKVLSDKTRLTDDKEVYFADRARYMKYAFDCQQWKAFLDLAKELETTLIREPSEGVICLLFQKKGY